MVAEIISTCVGATKGSKQDILVKRRGGGTLLDSRPIFSSDAKYVYLNCGWGVRVFSVKTGECVRSYNAFCNDESVASIFLHDGQPSCITSNGTLYSWDAKSGKTLIKHHLKIPSKTVVSNAFLVPRLHNPEVDELCVLNFNNEKSEASLKFFDLKNGQNIEHPLNNTVISDINSQHSVSFGGPEDNRLIASILSDSLHIISLNGTARASRIYPGEGRKWTCVRVHPSDYPVAAGDNTGRVVLFRNPLKKKKDLKPQAVYHWHTLPCRDIAFTPSGSLMYTGGGENVLVKWNLNNPQIRNYLPRLSGEITFIEVSSDFKYVAVATLDNSIKVIDPQSKLICVLQELAWGVLSVPGTSLFPAGLSFDPRSRAIVLNGRPGHLQFYSPFNETLIFNIDITLQNYLTQERDKVIYNTEVTGASVSSNGAWMATIETREDPATRLEQRLKFWEYNLDKKCFVLNTSIESPHNGKALRLKFRPGTKQLSVINTNSLDYMLITSGDDSKFRLWSPTEIDSVYRKGVVWGCENACFYRQMECGPLSFSEDGTILGVGFESTLVLWDLSELKVSASLSTTSSRKPIKFVEFGQFEGFCEVICATENEVFVWNIMTLNLTWKISIETSFLVQDVASSHFAIFTRSNDVLVFKPKSSEPVFKKEHVSDRKGEVLSAIFIPRVRHVSAVPTWMQDSQLFYINSNQELFCLESESESHEASSIMITPEIGPNTPFSSLLAAQTQTDIKKSKLKQNSGYGIVGSSAVSQLLKYPAHTMPLMSLLCGSFLQSLVQTKKQKENVKMDVDESDEGMEVDGSSSSDDNDDDDDVEEILNSSKSKSAKKTKLSKVSSSADGEDLDPTTAEKLSHFFKDLDDEGEINIFEDGFGKSTNFIFDGVSA